jgi:hypothetical protein
MQWDLVITKPAARDLKKVSHGDLGRIDAALAAMQANPYGGDVKFCRDLVARCAVGSALGAYCSRWINPGGLL